MSARGTVTWNSTPAPLCARLSGGRNSGADVPSITWAPASATHASGSPDSGGVWKTSDHPAFINTAAASYGSSVARIGVSTAPDYHSAENLADSRSKRPRMSDLLDKVFI